MLLVSGSSWVNAQLAVTTATLNGTVTDPSGAIVPHATVRLSSAQNGIARTADSDASGRYTFTQLPPATYTLAIQASGFESYTQTGIVLDSGQSATQNVTLTVGATTQQIVVNAQASQLNTDNANISADIDAKHVVELPLNLRTGLPAGVGDALRVVLKRLRRRGDSGCVVIRQRLLQAGQIGKQPLRLDRIDIGTRDRVAAGRRRQSEIARGRRRVLRRHGKRPAAA